MNKWTRMNFQPVLPLGADGRRVTGSSEHIALSRRAAAEGMVLLKNEQKQLPLAKGRKIALFGKGTIDYVRGGGGSGEVTVAYTRNLYQGMQLKEQEGKVALFDALPAFYEAELRRQYAAGAIPGMTTEPEVPEELFSQARAFTDTAVISICRFSGEDWDRKDSDFYLTEGEKAMIEKVKARFPYVIAVLNVGGIMDTSWFRDGNGIQSVLLSWQAGMEGGLATADILCGDANPSGKLTDTFALTFADYPSSWNFHESDAYAAYCDDIYVGYRYFETIPGAAERVSYPFGYGLSYTTFQTEVCRAEDDGETIRIQARVTNTGEVSGKEVVQVYYGAPQGKLGKPAKELAAYQKTRMLLPGESQVMTLEFPIDQMASYDDRGAVCEAAWVLEQGTYAVYVGNSVRDAQKIDYVYEEKENRVTARLSHHCVPHKLPKRLRADGTYEELPVSEYPAEEPGLERQDLNTLECVSPAIRAVERCHFLEKPEKQPIFLGDVAEGRASLDDFIAQLSEEELIHLLGGQPNTGVANTFGMGNLPEYGVPNVMTADGPAGLRINPPCGVTTTAFPCATLMACTWNTALSEEVGRAGAAEVKENNIGIWLTPAVNIHRSPLCGRNFEYYSEDPLVAGKTGAALVRGIQSMHIGASVKHFACNNKETNRKDSDSRVSERALREIYLKAFEIIVKEAEPYTIMSSYNRINGVQASENKDLLTGILREEWGFNGMVTTDWWTHGEHYRETRAGNDVKMGNGYPERVREALEKGLITRKEIEICAKRILEMILKMD